MVDGPEPVRLPASAVSGWGLLPRHRTHDALSGRAHHRDSPLDRSDDDLEAADGPCHHGPDENCWRDNCHAIRDREEPGHVNRQA